MFYIIDYTSNKVIASFVNHRDANDYMIMKSAQGHRVYLTNRVAESETLHDTLVKDICV